MFKLRRLLIGSVLVAAMAAAWFLAVDRSWFVESCPDCFMDRSVLEVRLFRRPISSRIDDTPSALQKVCVDLGKPCEHVRLERFHKHRWWGFAICACPCHNGTMGLSDDDSWYDEEAAMRLKAMAAGDPGMAGEFHQKVIVEHDYEQWRQLAERITSDKPESSDR